MGSIKVIVLDTHALLWMAFEPERLSSKADRAISSTKETAISSISIWETGIKIKNKKLEIPLSLDVFVERLKQAEGFHIVPVDEQVWLDSLSLEWKHRDPADRVIVATAKRLGCNLVTHDSEIRGFYRKAVW